MNELPAVVGWGLRATPLLLLAWAVCLVARRASAAQRHFMWTLAVVGALLTPAVTALAPVLSVPVLPGPEEVQPTGQQTPASPAVPVIATDASARLPDDPVLRAPGRTLRSAGLPGMAEWLGSLVWMVGVVVTGLLVLASLVGTGVAGRRARRVGTGRLADEVEHVRRALGIRRPLSLLLAKRETMPMTWGHWRPFLLLPASAPAWTPARRRAVLLHELAHVRRGDWLTQLVARAACIVYWWHPLVWLAAWRLRVERELACDDLVLAHGTGAVDYAQDLLEIARGYRVASSGRLVAVAMARPSQLAGRLMAVLDSARARRPLGRGTIAAALLVAGSVAVPSAGLRAVPADAQGIRASEVPDLPAIEALEVDPGPVGSRPDVAPAQDRTTLCDWSSRGRSRSSSTEFNDARATVRVVTDGCELRVRAEGEPSFSADERGIEAITGQGYFEIEERRGGERRRVEVTARGGRLERRWYVNGRETPWQAAADAWFAGMLQATFRHTSYQARERAQRLLRTRGPQGLQAEIPLLFSTSAMTAYYVALIEEVDLTPVEATRIAQDAGARITSSSALAEVLRALLGNAGADDAVRIAAVRASGHISSSSARASVLAEATDRAGLSQALADAVLQEAAEISSSSEKGRVLRLVAARLPPDRPLPGSYVAAARSISSSSELSGVLVEVLSRERLPPQAVGSVLEAAAAISSSSALGEVLRTLARRHPLEERTRGPFFEVTGQIGSSSERASVLAAVVQSGPDAATVAALLRSAEEIGSSSARADVLVEVARAGLLETEALRTAYRHAADSIGSRGERERVLRAAGMG